MALLLFSMELQQAKGIFHVEDRITIEELNTTFRSLVKKYHPDKLRDYQSWANERMTEINLAYETLAAWLTSKQIQDPQAEYRPPPPDDDPPRQESKPPRAFYTGFNLFLDGLGTYYQYGLENPNYRSEGVRRFRFREAMRSAENGRDALERCGADFNHPVVRITARFARLAVADIHLGEPAFGGGGALRQYDAHFRTARKLFDAAVKAIFFPELVPKHLHSRQINGLHAAYAGFVLYFTRFSEDDRQRAGIFQTARYDALMEMMELRDQGFLEF